MNTKKIIVKEILIPLFVFLVMLTFHPIDSDFLGHFVGFYLLTRFVVWVIQASRNNSPLVKESKKSILFKCLANFLFVMSIFTLLFAFASAMAGSLILLPLPFLLAICAVLLLKFRK